MTCIVLVRNPHGNGILAITEDDDDIAQWDTPDEAAEQTVDHALVRAWGGYVVDLENMEVTEL